ncbi:hypothetical protein [Bdellovibrio bacteriovorus]|uniref:hypothetical protein n=1 Tax=Bdellovibrio bacteriovorus TaxID=959 RepID=UPI0035A62E58
MSKSLQSISLGVLLSLTTAATAWAAVPGKPSTKVARPPQYVMISYDGGLDLNRWQETRNFAAEMRKIGKPVSFTYFLSGVYFLRDMNRHFYTPPKHDVGYSAIGFGESAQGIASRINLMNDSFAEGHEIASLANGGFNAHRENWAQTDWESEFRQFNDFIFGAYFNNGISPNSKYPQGYALTEKDIAGFRAPALGVNDALWPAMKAFHFRYDVSTPGEMTQWPTKDKFNVWRINIPMIELVGTGKRVLGMDYNFYYAHSKAKEDVAKKDQYKKSMFDSYMNYFVLNYYGRRAPISLSHRFAHYNGGAYSEALKDFIRSVCGMPEVKCVTVKEYANFLDTLTPEVLRAYRFGQFDMMPRPRRPAAETPAIPLAAETVSSEIQ